MIQILFLVWFAVINIFCAHIIYKIVKAKKIHGYLDSPDGLFLYTKPNAMKKGPKFKAVLLIDKKCLPKDN